METSNLRQKIYKYFIKTYRGRSHAYLFLYKASSCNAMYNYEFIVLTYKCFIVMKALRYLLKAYDFTLKK